MANVKKADYTEAYCALMEGKQAYKEAQDCTVIALSVVTGISYEEAHAVMASFGRKPGKAARGVDNAVRSQGFDLKRVDIKSIIAKYPLPHRKVLKNFTTHHPRRFPGCIDKSKVYLAHTRGHVLGIKDGVVHDWSINKSLRVYALYEVTPDHI